MRYRLAVIVVLSLFTLTGCSSSNGAFVLPNMTQVSDLIIEISKEIDVAATVDTLATSVDPADLGEVFATDTGGVWCAGAADYLRTAASALGWRAAKLQYGVEGRLTHAVTLILSADGWLIADAYLGNIWDKPLHATIQDLNNGNAVTYSGGGVTRDVHFSDIPTPRSPSWTIGRGNSFPLPCRQRLDEEGFTCTLHHDAQDFADKYGVESTLNLLERDGYPRDLSFLLLYPFGVHVNDSYTEVDSVEALLKILK